MLYPSDTVYGLGCNPFKEEAVDRVFSVKQRPQDKGVLLLIPGLAWLAELAAELPADTWALVEALWPGPLTLIFNGKQNLPGRIVGPRGTIGLRWPKNRFLQEWMELSGCPIVSTSANVSGQPIPATFPELQALFEGQVDLIIEARQLQESPPSTVVDLTGHFPSIIRPGSLCDQVRKYVPNVRGG